MKNSSMPTASDIWNLLCEWAPAELAEEWDNVGIQVGDPGAVVERVVIGLDPSSRILQHACKTGASMVITHHPLFLSPIRSLDRSLPTTALAADFLMGGVCLYSAHTNLDSAPGGVTDLLASPFQLQELVPIVPSSLVNNGGLGRIGRLARPMTLGDISDTLSGFLGNTCLMITGERGKKIYRPALCSGSGSSLWPMVVEKGADLYITAEIKHHIALEAVERGVALIDAGHFHTERPIVHAVKDFLQKGASARGWRTAFEVFEGESPPSNPWIGKIPS